MAALDNKCSPWGFSLCLSGYQKRIFGLVQIGKGHFVMMATHLLGFQLCKVLRKILLIVLLKIIWGNCGLVPLEALAVMMRYLLGIIELRKDCLLMIFHALQKIE